MDFKEITVKPEQRAEYIISQLAPRTNTAGVHAEALRTNNCSFFLSGHVPCAKLLTLPTSPIQLVEGSWNK